MAVRPPARPVRVASLLAFAAAIAGCAARPDRFAPSAADAGTRRAEYDDGTRRRDAAAPPDVRRGEMTGRAGFAAFGPRVRLRDDTPSVTSVIETERAAAATRRSDAEPDYAGASGPQGRDAGATLAPFTLPPTYYLGSYFGPVGFVPPGLRPASDEAPPPPIFTAPPSSNPGADVWRHRPGLSTGSGIYAR